MLMRMDSDWNLKKMAKTDKVFLEEQMETINKYFTVKDLKSSVNALEKKVEASKNVESINLSADFCMWRKTVLDTWNVAIATQNIAR